MRGTAGFSAMMPGGTGFTDVTVDVNAVGPSDYLCRGSSMCDLDNDGDLDIFESKVNQDEKNILFIQNGADTTFLRAEDSAGVSDVGHRGATHAVGDYDTHFQRRPRPVLFRAVNMDIT